MVYIIISSIIIKSVPSKRSNCYIIQVNYCHLGMWALLSVFPIFLRSINPDFYVSSLNSFRVGSH